MFKDMEGKETVTITLNGVEQEATVNWRRDYQGRYGTKPRVYVSIQDESLAENLENRRNRPVKVYRDIVKQALQEIEVGVEKLLWSQYAGCTCACSPGFVLTTSEKRYSGKDAYMMTDIWVTVKKQAKVFNDGDITPLENYGFGEFGRSVSAAEKVESDTLVMCQEK